MEFVCNDLDGQSGWYYDAGEKMYTRYNSTGAIDNVAATTILARIFGVDIPNPDMIWAGRCRAANTMTNTTDGMRFKPSPVTYSLFAHWQGVKDA